MAFVRFDVGGGAGDGRVVGHVDRDEARTEAVGGGLAALGIAGADDHGVAQFGQPAGGLVAEALVGPRDEGDSGHESSIGPPAAGSQGCLDRRKTRTTHRAARR